MSQDICLLHIGKTGGTYLRSLLEHNQDRIPSNLHILGHEDTIKTTRKKYGEGRELAFIFRDPTERFVSGFNSRLRQGRPTYNSIWSTGEAAAFQWFSTPNALAEALSSPDERMRSAALFSMENISHLKNNYAFFLKNVALLRQEDARIRVCVNLCDLDRFLPQIMARLGIEDYDRPPAPAYHKSPVSSELSNLAKRNLRLHWKAEYKIYAYCKSIQRF
jgi:hypothetical protein